MDEQSTSSAYQGYVDPAWPNPGLEGDARFIIYGYVPSTILSGLALALFTIALIVHSSLLWRYRTWYFSTVPLALLMEIGGYVARMLSGTRDPYLVAYFVAQYFLIVVAPVLLSAAIYTIVSILISIYGHDCSPLPPKLILWGFITCDIIATIVQVVGAGLVGSAYSTGKDPNIPNNVLLAGLAFQVFCFALFLILLALVLMRSRNRSKQVSRSFLAATIVARLSSVGITLSQISRLTICSTCFRLAETADGLQASISTHEVYFACLEFAPIVLAVYTFMYWHPGRFLQRGPPT